MINFFIDCEGEKVAGHGKLIPKKCMNAAERIPDSVLKVKAWYDAGFLEPLSSQTLSILFPHQFYRHLRSTFSALESYSHHVSPHNLSGDRLCEYIRRV